ncbi:MAG: hypothetical protein CMJ25_14595 [Phycisphaerae bacterium]|nr:hypothetical protein [Phycisphaerae bacterium]|tara:strand:+ start:168 stop:473 length:306 start_codon:yes stop_codon:yes gene_type:complete
MDATRQTSGRIRFKKRHGLDVKKQDPKLPSKSNMAKNTIVAAGQLIKNGFKVVSTEERNDREKICQRCEHFRKKDNRCAKCGCHLQWKNRMRAWHCPEKKW